MAAVDRSGRHGSSPEAEASALDVTSGKESDELGYLLLEDCEAQLLPSDSAANIPRRTWLSVEWKHASKAEADITATADESNKECCCPRCNLVFEMIVRDSSMTSELVLKNTPEFNGTVPDMAADSTSCPSTCVKKGNRSDAALLMGLAITCQSHDHILIRHVQVMLKEEKEGAPESEHGIAIRMALLITFTMPSLLKMYRAGSVIKSILPADAASSKKRVSKPLPPSTQLLLSILRSDWEFLEQTMSRLQALSSKESATRSSIYHLESDGSLTKSTTSFFPSKLSLEELYQRFRGVTSAIDEPKSNVQFACLPQEILVTSIAPFLRARSLEALRCSCKFLHRVLRSVVPGLKLRLYTHQIRSLEWMRKREATAITEERILSFHPSVCGTENVRVDLHRAVTGGATTCLRFRPNGSSKSSTVFRIDQQTGREIDNHTTADGNFALSRKVARGGLLCDDPGLGKTITVLSLILQTSGLSTESTATASALEPPLSNTDEDIFHAYWQEHVPVYYRKQSFKKILGTLRRSHPAARLFEHPLKLDEDVPPDYFDIIKRPMCFETIYGFIMGSDDYGRDFEQFRKDVDQCFQNALTYNPPDHFVHKATLLLSRAFAELIADFKNEQVQTAKKSFSRSTAKPNSSVAALLERRNHDELISSLKPTAANLLVVPGTLLNHWEEQLRMHADLTYISEGKIPLIYHYNEPEGLGEVVDLCQTQKTHFPCIFIDKAGTKRLPPANILAMFRIVITTTQRFTNEWKHGNFEEELKSGDGGSRWAIPYELDSSKYKSRGACSLLKVHWFRMIVDEGHSMGRGANTSAILFASWIMAERRWAMTGTPTPQTVSQSGLNNLRGLVRFLQHEFFTPRLDGDKIWQGSIVRCWNNGNLSAFFRLQSLMMMLMVRHTKLDIAELPPPKFHRTLLKMSSEEITAYNPLVCAIQSNLLITSMEGLTSGRQDSLLFRSQAKHAREAFNNVRLACSGGTRVVPIIDAASWRETIEMLCNNGVTGVRLQIVENFYQRAITGQLSGCHVCGLQLSTLLIVSCGHLVCTECMTNKTVECPVCAEPFDVDAFQRLQPGIVYKWQGTLNEPKKTKEVVNADEESNTLQAIDLAGNVAIQPPPERRRTRKYGDGHTCEFDVAAVDGKCTLCFQEHYDCVMVDTSRCEVCGKVSEMCPEEESKSFYVSNKLMELHTTHAPYSNQQTNALCEKRPLKAIVFSEFRKTLNLVGDRLLRRFGGGCVAEFWGKDRGRELLKFAKSPDCFCMLLGKDGSEGLDLSFVTHIFFLEQVWDKSLENQAISRAWRMGAKGHVEVETLVTRESVEETMLDIEQTLASAKNASSDMMPSPSRATGTRNTAKEYQRAKLLFLLKNLKLIRPPPTRAARAKRHIDAVGKATCDDSEAPKKVSRVTFQD